MPEQSPAIQNLYTDEMTAFFDMLKADQAAGRVRVFDCIIDRPSKLPQTQEVECQQK